MFSNVLYKRNVLVWWLFNSDNTSCIGRLFPINSTLRFLQCLSGHTCLQFIYSQKACFEANPMVTFLFKMVHSFRSYGLDGFGWRSENSNSAVTHFVMLPLPLFCVPSPYSAQRALCLHVFASPVMRVQWHSVLFVQIKIYTHKKYNKCLYICRHRWLYWELCTPTDWTSTYTSVTWTRLPYWFSVSDIL